MQSCMTRIDCGPISFTRRYRERDGGASHSQNDGRRGGNHADHGVSIRVLGQAGETETEILRFDCFEHNPHYHYGPRNRNEPIFLDTTVVSDPLQWALGLFKGGKLPATIEPAGYPTIAAQLDNDVLASALREVEAKIPPMMAAAHG